MKWNEEDSYVRYNIALNATKRILGLTALDLFSDRPELVPYITYVLEYLNKELILLGDNAELKELVQKTLDIFFDGSNEIVDLKSTDLAEKIGISTTTGEIQYETERFVFVWSNVFTDLSVRLRFQYAYLFADDYDPECCKCGAHGETTTDYEAWRSGIYPEDELYDRSVLYNDHTSWGTQTPRDVDCGCLRHR